MNGLAELREDFEKWAKEENLPLKKGRLDYANERTYTAWCAWRAALSTAHNPSFDDLLGVATNANDAWDHQGTIDGLFLEAVLSAKDAKALHEFIGRMRPTLPEAEPIYQVCDGEGWDDVDREVVMKFMADTYKRKVRTVYTHPAPPSGLVKAAEDAIATLRCLSADKDMAGEWGV